MTSEGDRPGRAAGIGRRAFLVGAPLALAACAPGVPVWAPDEAVARAAYRHSGPPMLSLYTMKNVDTGNGAHTGLMISASQRVVFDPAGTFGHESLPERNDVIFGITPRIEEFYETYHARATYYVVIQKLEVRPEAAEKALRLALDYGPVGKARCTRATADILRQVPGIDGIGLTLFPDTLMRSFGRQPGVVTTELREADNPDKEAARRAFDLRMKTSAASSGG